MPIQTELLATILARLTPDGSPADAASAAGVWRILFSRFGPLIGPLSTGLLFERTLLLHMSAFPWLKEAGSAPDVGVMDAFVRVLEGRPAEDIEAANRVLLKSFTDELAGLIGASLASRLLETTFGADRVQDNI